MGLDSLKTHSKTLFIIMILILLEGCKMGGGNYSGRRDFDFDDEEITVSEEDTTSSEEEEEETQTRADEAFEFNADFCACNNSNPIVANRCSSFCSAKDTSDQDTLFVDVSLYSEIINGDPIDSLYNWCFLEIEDGNTGPSCSMVFVDSNGDKVFIPIEQDSISGDSTSFDVVIDDLVKDTQYLAYLQEMTSGMVSRKFNFRKTDIEDASDYADGPLKIEPIHQYGCIQRQGVVSGSDDFYNVAAAVHFYYRASDSPDPLAPGNQFYFCHDIEASGQGLNDSAFYPRYELYTNHFSLWSKEDIRTYDLDANGTLDINQEISETILDQFGISQDMNLFFKFEWATFPGENLDGDAVENLGYYMVPWVDENSDKAYCPGEEDYNSDKYIFRALKDFIGVPTEGLFIAEGERVKIANQDGELQDGPDNIVFIRENLLNKIWFHYENDQHIQVSETSQHNKDIHFYWPPMEDSPFDKKSYQRLFTVKSPSDIGVAEVDDARTSVNPSDNRFGCIPMGAGGATEDPYGEEKYGDDN